VAVQGPVERKARAFVRSLGELSPRDEVTAATLVAAAQRLDGAGSTSAAAALATRVTRLLGLLTPSLAGDGSGEVRDATTAVQDEVAAKRQARAGGVT
jgi:hypothetical protein